MVLTGSLDTQLLYQLGTTFGFFNSRDTHHDALSTRLSNKSRVRSTRGTSSETGADIVVKKV